MNWQEFVNLHKVPVKYHNPVVTEKSDKKAYSQLNSWLQNPKPSLLLIGEPGRGKTYATYYLMKNILSRMPAADMRFFRSSDADQRMLEEFKQWGSARHFIDRLCEIDYLFLDDFGIECSTERMERNYYDIIDKRISEHKPMVISTNISVKKHEELFGARIASRLQEFIPIKFQGIDIRSQP